MRSIWAGTLLALAIGSSLCGCSKPDAYPRVPAATAVGQSSQCDQCGKAIPAVGKEHLHHFQGVQYTVCSEACGKRLEQAVVNGTFEAGVRRR